jgi:copper transport protein
VRLVFDDRIRLVSGDQAVANTGGSILAGRPFQPSGSHREVLIPLRAHLPRGAYSVKWRVLSDDGHVEEGVLAFAVGLGSRRPVSVLQVTGTGPTARQVFSRWLFYLGLLTAFGAAAFILLVVRPIAGRLGLDADPGALLVLMFGGLVVAFFGAGGLAAYQHHAAVTRSSLAFSAGAMLSSLGAAGAAIRLSDRSLPLFPLPFVFALAAVPAFAGHAFDAGQPRWLNALVDMVHVGAAGTWLGGLLALTLAAPRVARTVARDHRGAFSRELILRFSAVALLSVAVLAATGVVRALFELSSLSQLWTTGYGRAIVIKSGLLGVLIVIGWLNRYRLVPRGETRRSQRNVRVEIVLLTGAVLAVAFLTDLPPGRSLGPPRSARAVLRLDRGDRDRVHDVRHAAPATEVVHRLPQAL